MHALVLVLLLAAQEADPDWQLNEEIAAERMKAAAEFERLKQFAWARAEYSKVLRLHPDHEEAKAKLEGAKAIPRSNQGKGGSLVARREDLLQSVATKAAAGFRIKAKALAGEKREEDALRAWQWTLLYAPTDPAAMSALKLAGKGSAAADSIYGDANYPARLAKADIGQPSTERSHIDKRWNSNNPKRVTANLVIEAVGVPADALPGLARVAEAEIAFFRLALGNAQAPLGVRRIVVMSGREAYERYIDDFIGGTPDERKRHKNTGGMHNEKYREFATWTFPKDIDGLEMIVSHKVAEYMLPTAWVVWLQESAAHLATQLFLQKSGGSCISPKEGTEASSGDWTDPKKVDIRLREKVLAGTDDDYEIILNTALATISSSQLAKSISILKFLILRFPERFRSVVAGAKADVRTPKAMLEKALGFSLAELDEFWRRWFLAK